MKVCFPVEVDSGLESRVYGHFGSAPVFIIVDTHTGKVGKTINRDRNHEHGRCSPVAALGGTEVDAVVVGGIGAGAINGLTRAGIKVLKSGAETVKANLDMLADSLLAEIDPADVNCAHSHGGHSHGGGCSHG